MKMKSITEAITLMLAGLSRFNGEPHCWTIAMHDQAFAWLNEKLSRRLSK